MKKNHLVAVALSGVMASLSGGVNAASVLFDEASNIPLNQTAYEEANSFKVTYAGFLPGSFIPPVLPPNAGVIAETAGSTIFNLGWMGFTGTYQSNSAQLSGFSAGSSKLYAFNIYEDAAFTQLSDTLAITLTRSLTGSRVFVNAAFYSDSLTGYIPTLLTGPFVQNIVETGKVQTVLNQYGLEFSFRSDVEVPIPAAAFFVAPALLGVFGVSRRRQNNAAA